MPPGTGIPYALSRTDPGFSFDLIPTIGQYGFGVLSGLLYGGDVPWFKDVSGQFTSAQQFVLRLDPLTFDLDGDGIETVGINSTNPIYFDHDGDGNKTSTGWIRPDDGFLTLDRNGNGTIDNGTELFGDSTPIDDGQGGVRNAADGFEALQAQDTNSDG